MITSAEIGDNDHDDVVSLFYNFSVEKLNLIRLWIVVSNTTLQTTATPIYQFA